jgi:putative ABC transport system permease protein
MKKFFLLTYRNLLKQKVSSVVNIAGLAIGLASFILIGLYVYDEFQFDEFHQNKDNVYRLTGNLFNKDVTATYFPALLYDKLEDGFPEIDKIVRIHCLWKASVWYEETRFREAAMIFVDSEFFDVFCFGLEKGSLESFHENPYAVILPRATANRYFGDDDPIGKVLNLHGGDYIVTGILKDIPRNSHLQFDLVFNFQALNNINPFLMRTWGNYSSSFYLLVKDGTDTELLGEKILPYFLPESGENIDGKRIRLQNLRNIYLGSSDLVEILPGPRGSKSAFRIFSVSALFILLLACFNYINLTTAKSSLRAREVGIRKVMGAGKKQLIFFFLMESFVICSIAMLFSLLIVEVSLPYFSQIAGKEISFLHVQPLELVLFLLMILIGVSFLSGIYPAFVLSAFNPVVVLKGSALFISQQLKGNFMPKLRFRQLLIVLQFAMAVGLVSSSMILYKQIKFSLSNSGFQKDQLLVFINSAFPNNTQSFFEFKNQMNQYPFVSEISSGGYIPSNSLGNRGNLHHLDQTKEEASQIYFAPVDYDYFKALGVNLIWGRWFDQQRPSDTLDAVILNQTAARLLGIENGQEEWFTGFWDGNNKKVIGVVEDVRFESSHFAIKPSAFFPTFVPRYYPSGALYIMVRFDNNIQADKLVQLVESTWQDVAGQNAFFEYFFMDQTYDNLYKRETQIASVSWIFTFLAIFIALLGLMGTTIYIMEARKKELGIRKVLGASQFRLAVMISREFIILVILALIIAWPITYHFMSGWLDTFVYRIEPGMEFFIISGTGAIILALSIINIITFKQARENPVNSLRFE